MKFTAYSGPYGDQMTDYSITEIKAKTLREFVDEVLEDKREWGYIGIFPLPKEPEKFSVFGYPNVEYRYGKLVSENFSKEYLDKEISEVKSNGGWSRMDYRIILKN